MSVTLWQSISRYYAMHFGNVCHTSVCMTYISTFDPVVKLVFQARIIKLYTKPYVKYVFKIQNYCHVNDVVYNFWLWFFRNYVSHCSSIYLLPCWLPYNTVTWRFHDIKWLYVHVVHRVVSDNANKPTHNIRYATQSLKLKNTWGALPLRHPMTKS